MSKIREQYQSIRKELPKEVQLIAVSKTHPIELIQEVYDAGQKLFGENKVQELMSKYEHLPSDIQWHLIGHLQSNKVKYIAPFVHTIQSVDSEKLLKEIDRQASINNRSIEIYLQVKIAKEETKYGLSFEACTSLIYQIAQNKYPNIHLTGLMGMASFTKDEVQIKEEFLSLKSYYDEMQPIHALSYLSMGMSGDFSLAIECGSNSVRIGSAIFGTRTT